MPVNPKKGVEARDFAAKINAAGSRAASAPSAAPASEASADTDDAFDQIRKLGELKDAGLLTEEEFNAKKAEMLKRL